MIAKPRIVPPRPSRPEGELVSGSPSPRKWIDKRFGRAGKDWLPGELDILKNKLGLIPDEELSKILNRSPNALKITATRRLHQARSSNFYTAWHVARVCGIKDSHTINFWNEKGFITGRKSSVGAGKNLRWLYTEDAIIQCIRRRPWLCILERMADSKFKAIVLEEYKKDPWFETGPASKIIGINRHTLVRYLNLGLISSERAPGGPWQWRHILRMSTINNFLSGYKGNRRIELRSVAYKVLKPIKCDGVSCSNCKYMFSPQCRLTNLEYDL